MAAEVSNHRAQMARAAAKQAGERLLANPRIAAQEAQAAEPEQALLLDQRQRAQALERAADLGIGEGTTKWHLLGAHAGSTFQESGTHQALRTGTSNPPSRPSKKGIRGFPLFGDRGSARKRASVRYVSHPLADGTRKIARRLRFVFCCDGVCTRRQQHAVKMRRRALRDPKRGAWYGHSQGTHLTISSLPG